MRSQFLSKAIFNSTVIYNIYKCKTMRSQFLSKAIYLICYSCQPDDGPVGQNMLLR
jgi:hypothetical protein